MKLTEHNPLARHRLFKLERDFASPKGLMSATVGHEDRVRWQLHRIYRARNNLVHSGRQPTFLDSLVANLDDFFRGTIGTIVNLAAVEKEPTIIDQAVTDIGFEYRMFKEFLLETKNDAAYSIDAVKRIVRMPN